MEISLIPLLSDNYGYLLHDAASRQTAVVDPSEAAPVLAFAKARGLGSFRRSIHPGGPNATPAPQAC